MSENIQWFGFSDRELETANILIKDGWYGTLPELHKCVQLLCAREVRSERKV